MTESNRPAEAPDPSDQIDETVRSLVEIHDERVRQVGFGQKFANKTTFVLARSVAVVGVSVLMLAWIVGNVLAGAAALDPAPFAELNLFGTVGAFIVTLLILTTQRHEQEADRKRDELTLHVAMLTEQKIAKVIALLEEQRRDNPMLETRRDEEAETMGQPVDPRESLARIEKSGLGRSAE